jgi:hypothetical protein
MRFKKSTILNYLRKKQLTQFLMSILMVNSKELFITQMEYMLIVLMKMFVAGNKRTSINEVQKIYYFKLPS